MLVELDGANLARGCWRKGIVAHEIGEVKPNILNIF